MHKKAAARPVLVGNYRITTRGGEPTYLVRLSDPELKQEMADFKAKIAADPEYSRDLLRQAGIITPTGKLTKRFSHS